MQTTKEELSQLFAPYCNLIDVIMKERFSFVNTQDEAGAAAAKDALHGAIVNGQAIQVHFGKEPGQKTYQKKEVAVWHDMTYGSPHMGFGGTAPQKQQIEATRNLHVSGYGQGTTAEQIQDVFGRICSVVRVVSKDRYCFVNTSSIEDAAKAKQTLQGAEINGGKLQINNAKDRDVGQ